MSMTAPLAPTVFDTAVMPLGFRAGAATMGIKASGHPDVAMVAVAEGLPDAAVAAVYTTNAVLAAPIIVSQGHLAQNTPEGGGRFGRTRSVICTAGCANAATGPDGEEDQRLLARAMAEGLDIDATRTLALSTGLIGTRLPARRIYGQVVDLARAGLGDSASDLAAAADAMRTTDSRAKVASVKLELPDTARTAKWVTVTGIAKGVGMMHPRMATMLSILMTDARAEPVVLHELLQRATVQTWDQLTVDGDTSTNDTVFLLASGASGCSPVLPGSTAADSLGDAIGAVARSLARQQAADGEGATTLISCTVMGARDDAEARAVARSVVGSSLVKAAFHGRDPNWGRIVAAAGNARLADAAILVAAGMGEEEATRRAGSPARLDVATLRVRLCGVEVFAGVPRGFDREALRRLMDVPEATVELDLAIGQGRGEAWGCDLSERYVRENSEYST